MCFYAFHVLLLLFFLLQLIPILLLLKQDRTLYLSRIETNHSVGKPEENDDTSLHKQSSMLPSTSSPVIERKHSVGKPEENDDTSLHKQSSMLPSTSSPVIKRKHNVHHVPIRLHHPILL